MNDLPFDLDDLDELDYCKLLDFYAEYDASTDFPDDDPHFDQWLYSMI